MPRIDDTPRARRQSPCASRRRKQHLRVFTGCAPCRRRHVKCDEHAPSCTNCTRLSLCCNYNRDFSFRITLPDDYQQSKKSRGLRLVNEFCDNEGHEQLPSHMMMMSPNTHSESTEESPRAPLYNDAVDFQEVTEDLGLPGIIDISVSPIYALETFLTPNPTDYSMLYYNHFLTTVSRILIIYDTPSNSNPYRSFPRLAGSSGVLQKAMIALGAQHLASLPGTQDTKCHQRAAMGAYAEAVSQLKDHILGDQLSSKLESLSTSLLLCLFDQISSAGSEWRIHLMGACQVFESIYESRPTASDEGIGNQSFTNSMRRFLVSLLSYLDIAAACATGEGTLIQGYYWEKCAGDWEYNLGTPSFYIADNEADRVLSQLRHSWTRVMAILADISKFAKTRQHLSDHQREMLREDLAHRIKCWHNSAPNIYARLSQLDEIPIDSSDRDIEDLTAAACIQTYAYACMIYLRRVSIQRLSDPSTDPELRLPVDQILRLCLNFSDGLNRMALLWPLFTAGAALADEHQQALVRESLVQMKCFGFKVCRATELHPQVDLLTEVQARFKSSGNLGIHMAATAVLRRSQLRRF